MSSTPPGITEEPAPGLPQPQALPPASRSLLPWVSLALFATLWLDLCRQLSFEWSTNEQYAYGWFVPFLSLGLFWKRWQTKPGQPDYGTTGLQDDGIAGRRGFFLLFALCFLLCLLLLPLRVIHEVNPDWPLFSWAIAGIVVLLTLFALYLMGGWPWVSHFAFPVCFMLVAVRWSSRIEGPLTQGLMRLDATITVEVLSWLNIPAVQHGNVIELATGNVGVNEACSGIRSFQSSLMAALFLGELYRLRMRTRLWLIAGGLLLAFGFNVVRTFFLGYQANNYGTSAIDKWHDSAGFTIAIATFVVLWVFAVIVAKRGLAPSSYSPVVPSSGGPVVPWSRGPVVPFLLAIGCWSLLTVAATEIWYRTRGAIASSDLHWSVTMPESKPGFERIEITKREFELLKYDSANGSKWLEEDGSEWVAFYFRWEGKSIGSMVDARRHNPEVCLPGSGFQQLSAPQLDVFQAGSLDLPFRKATYSADGVNMYVFYCVWQDGDERRRAVLSRLRRDRLTMALEGRRLSGQQTFELVVKGYSSMAEAEQAVRQRLPSLIRIKDPTVSAESPKVNRAGILKLKAQNSEIAAQTYGIH